MEGLQRKLVDEKRDRLIYGAPGYGVSSGTIGILGLPVRSSTPPFELFHVSPGATDFFFWVIQTRTPTALQPRPIVKGFRSGELEWRRTHADVLRAYANEWVSLEGEEIVAHGGDPIQVVAEARAKGIQTPYVFYVEPITEDAAIGL